ncbi:hypothetical protein ACRAWF_13160 [Streptomyces sp. L7]
MPGRSERAGLSAAASAAHPGEPNAIPPPPRQAGGHPQAFLSRRRRAIASSGARPGDGRFRCQPPAPAVSAAPGPSRQGAGGPRRHRLTPLAKSGGRLGISVEKHGGAWR